MENIYEGSQPSNRREIEEINAYLFQIMMLINNRYKRREIRKELQDSLEDEMQELVAEGYSINNAVSCALENMGTPEEIAREYNSVYASQFSWAKMIVLWGGTLLIVLFSGLGVNFGQQMFSFNALISRVVGFLLLIIAGITFCWEEVNEFPFLYGVGGFNINSSMQNLIAIAIMGLSTLHTLEVCIAISIMMMCIKSWIEEKRVRFERKYIFSIGRISKLRGRCGFADFDGEKRRVINYDKASQGDKVVVVGIDGYRLIVRKVR